MITCLADWAAIRPKASVSIFMPRLSPISDSGSSVFASSSDTSISGLVRPLDHLLELEDLHFPQFLVEAHFQIVVGPNFFLAAAFTASSRAWINTLRSTPFSRLTWSIICLDLTSSLSYSAKVFKNGQSAQPHGSAVPESFLEEHRSPFGENSNAPPVPRHRIHTPDWPF
jgi:hypothetical protein